MYPGQKVDLGVEVVDVVNKNGNAGLNKKGHVRVLSMDRRELGGSLFVSELFVAYIKCGCMPLRTEERKKTY